MKLEEFEQELRALIGRPTDLRPFVCEGSPIDCEVFLVGFNPATILDADFWDFWRSDHGYDKSAWFHCYIEERAARPTQVGRKRRYAISPTRRNIECFVHGATGVRVLETNIYSKPSDDMKGLDLASREITPFKFLLEAIKPKVIVVHGKPTLAAIEKFSTSAKIIGTNHFSRGTSCETARQFGEIAAKEGKAFRVS